MMVPIPAVDISSGHAVRLEQGRFDRITRFADDPLLAVGRWVDLGANRVHLVDLDAARTGQAENAAVIRRILAAWPEVQFQLGGGIRSLDVLDQWMQIGVTYPVLGTAAVLQSEFVSQAAQKYPNRLILALDARDGKLATKGWIEHTEQEVLSVAKTYASLPLEAILHTDIGRDGVLTGPNLEASRQLAESQPHAVLVSGGVRHLQDIQTIKAMNCFSGAICGRALYEGHLDLAAALELCRRDLP
ncbi:MAG: HisA/HisF-related TIM barrel protein [Gammaproteobacteria bacterium]